MHITYSDFFTLNQFICIAANHTTSYLHLNLGLLVPAVQLLLLSAFVQLTGAYFPEITPGQTGTPIGLTLPYLPGKTF